MAGAGDRQSGLNDFAVARLVSKPGEPPRDYQIRNGRILIGHSIEADLVLADATVSRRHAEIKKSLGGFSISDLGSTNGTFVGGKKLAPNTSIAIANDDEIQIGALHFNFKIPPSPLPVPSRSSRLRMRIGIFAVVLVIALLIASYLMERSGGKSIPMRISPAPGGAPWMSKLNYYRELAGLPPVTEDPGLSIGDANHARYVVANQGAMIRTGKIDGSIHDEDPAKPFFSIEGKKAGAGSDVDAIYSDPPEPPEAG